MLKIVEHFDLEYTEIGGDYSHVTIELDSEVLAEYGDDYHDKGLEKAEGFVQGWYKAQGLEPQEPEYESREFGTRPEDYEDNYEYDDAITDFCTD